MLPAPSLGPALLSASWSPPLFCGIPDVALGTLVPPEALVPLEVLEPPEALPEPPDVEWPGAGMGDAEGADADVGDGEDDALPLDPPPQPAAAIAVTASTATHAAIKRDLRMILPYLASDIPARSG